MTKAFSKVVTTEQKSEAPGPRLELQCPVATLAGLRAAVANGADGVLLDFGGPASLCNHCAGQDQFHALARSVRYAIDHQVTTTLAVDSHHPQMTWSLARTAIDTAAGLGIDAVALSDTALMLYTSVRHPHLQLHYAVPVSEVSAEAIGVLCRQIGIRRLVLPRMATLDQVRQIAERTGVEIELAGFGPLCNVVDHSSAAASMADGPAKHMRSSLEAVCLDVDADHASGGSCALDERASNDHYYLDIGNAEFSALRLLPQLSDAGVRALRIEAHQHSPLKLAQATRVWREAIDECLEDRESYSVRLSWVERLSQLSPVLRSCT